MNTREEQFYFNAKYWSSIEWSGYNLSTSSCTNLCVNGNVNRFKKSKVFINKKSNESTDSRDSSYLLKNGGEVLKEVKALCQMTKYGQSNITLIVWCYLRIVSHSGKLGENIRPRISNVALPKFHRFWQLMHQTKVCRLKFAFLLDFIAFNFSCHD